MLLLVTAALAFDSETQPVALHDAAELFTSAELSSGYLPSGSPLAVEFRLEALGGGEVFMEGQGDVTWPTPLSLTFTGDPGSGIFMLDASIDAVTTVLVDLSDYGYSDTFEIDRRSLTMDGATFFDPFVMETQLSVTDVPQSLQVIDYSYDIFGGIASLNFDADLNLEVNTTFEGAGWTVNDDTTIQAENEQVVLEPDGEPDFVVAGVYRALWSANMAAVFTPAIEVCASFVGCIEVASFEVPVDIITESFEQDMPLERYAFPMPLLVTDVESGDFGEVEVGDLANLEVPLVDEGNLEAYGTASIVGGDGAFTVYPPTFNALPGTEDGLVVTFEPPAEGDLTATLVLESNDPANPTLEIPLTGTGFVPESDNTDNLGESDGDEIKADVTGCGCSGSGGVAPGIAGLLLGVALLGWRRRA